MEISVFLAKVIGLYLVIISLFVLIRQKLLISLFPEMLQQKSLIFFIAIVTLMLGILLVVSHNLWVMDWRVVITIFAWLVLVGGLVRLFLPEQSIQMGQYWAKHPSFLRIIAIIYLIIGIFLLYKAYFVT